jgi:hypothetical protein
VSFSRTTPTGTTEDMATFGIHFVMRPGVAGLSDHLVAGDASAVEGLFQTKCWDVIKPLIANDWSYAYLAWRNFGASFPQDERGITKHGPVWRAGPVASPGTSTFARLPDQVASTVSYRTCSRRHWGRSYVGGLTTDALIDSKLGRIHNGVVDAFAGAWEQFFESCQALPRMIEPVVWSAKYRAVMSVHQIVVDDVPDTIRRRRPKQAAYRKIISS